MNDNEKLYNAITGIDGSFVDEAAGYEKPKRAPIYVRLIYAAAALILIFGAVFALTRIIKTPDSGHAAALITEKPTQEPTESTAGDPKVEPAAEETNMPVHDPAPDPIVPGTRAHDLAMVIGEWFDKTGAVELRMYENGTEKDRVTITERKTLAPVTRALKDCFEVFISYTQGDDFTDQTVDSAHRIDVSGDGAALIIWEGVNYVRYQKGDFTRWFLLEGYEGRDHGEEFVFDEIVKGLFPIS